MDHEERDYYANFVQVTTSLYDVTLNFKVQTPVSLEQGEKPIVESRDVCSIRMSPQHAKSVAALLVKHIADYEGEQEVNLPIPPNVEEIWRKYCK